MLVICCCCCDLSVVSFFFLVFFSYLAFVSAIIAGSRLMGSGADASVQKPEKFAEDSFGGRYPVLILCGEGRGRWVELDNLKLS